MSDFIDEGAAHVLKKLALCIRNVKLVTCLLVFLIAGCQSNIETDEIKELKKLATSGVLSAQYHLASYYSDGIGTKIDDKQALYWYTKAAENGSSDAQYFLGELYERGVGTRVDQEKSFYWNKQSMELGDRRAKEKHKRMSFCCWDSPYDINITDIPEEVISFYEIPIEEYKKNKDTLDLQKKIALKGDPVAQKNTGLMYLNGIYTEKNQSEAIYWLTKSSDNGYDEAEFNLGLIYYRGDGVEKDEEKSINLYIRSANQGNPKAQNNLANIFSKLTPSYQYKYLSFDYFINQSVSIGGSIDSSRAWSVVRSLREMSAKKGDPYAQQSVGMDNIKKINDAYFWYLLSTKNGNKYAEEARFILEKKLSSDEILKINKKSSESMLLYQDHERESRTVYYLSSYYKKESNNKSIELSNSLSKRAVEMGHIKANRDFGRYLLNKLGIENVGKSIQYLEVAESGGDKIASLYIGIAHAEYSKFFKLDLEKNQRIEKLEEAAFSGSEDAAVYLAYYYDKYHKDDKCRSYAWLLAASTFGSRVWSGYANSIYADMDENEIKKSNEIYMEIMRNVFNYKKSDRLEKIPNAIDYFFKPVD